MVTSRSGASLTLEHLEEMDTDRPPAIKPRRRATTRAPVAPEAAHLDTLLPSRLPQGGQLPEVRRAVVVARCN